MRLVRKIFFSAAVALSVLLSACAHLATAEAAAFEAPIAIPVTWSFSCAFPEDRRDVVRRGVEFWNKELGREVFTEDPACFDGEGGSDMSSSVIFYYNGKRSKPDSDGNYTLAFAMRWKNRNHFVGAGVMMFKNWYDEDLAVAEEVTRHEIGHVLGFNHMRSRSCLMFPYSGDGSKGLCPAERRILERVYGKEAR